MSTYGDGAETTKIQMEQERGWVELRDDGIAEERVTVKIHRNQASNNWPCWCRLQEGNFGGEASLLLKAAGAYLDKDIRFWREDIINLWGILLSFKEVPWSYQIIPNTHTL